MEMVICQETPSHGKHIYGNLTAARHAPSKKVRYTRYYRFLRCAFLSVKSRIMEKYGPGAPQLFACPCRTFFHFQNSVGDHKHGRFKPLSRGKWWLTSGWKEFLPEAVGTKRLECQVCWRAEGRPHRLQGAVGMRPWMVILNPWKTDVHNGYTLGKSRKISNNKYESWFALPR